MAKLLALQARPSLSWAHGRRDAGVEASGSGRSSVGDNGYDPLELEDETESSGASLTLGPTVDWLEFKHEVQVNRGLVVDRLVNHQPGGGEADGFSGQSRCVRRCRHGRRKWRRCWGSGRRG